ncbi:hypothetical protein F9K33_07060 [bacterium]|nr:MAG: hypothetical protein F9K33_07060 [bacterium]
MKINQQEIIEFILHELPANRQQEIYHLVQHDEDWKAEFDKWSSVIQNINNEKQYVAKYDDIPDRYWSTFLPRVRDRIDTKTRRRAVFRERFVHAFPSFGLALVILFFLNSVLLTNQKIDYLLDQYDWVSSLNSTRIIDHYIGQNKSAVDEFISDVLNNDEADKTALTYWEETINPTESVLDYSALSPEEQNELLDNLEKITTF